VNVSEASLTTKDREDLAFGIAHNVDYVALSFVRDAESIFEIKRLIGDKNIPVVAKLEKPEALDNLEAIVDATDVVMVARGDLGVEISTQKVPVVQKRIIELCQKKSVPVITATQMLDSMIVNPTPTRAEASDVANAIFDGTDAVMLSGETAFGKYPLESVQMMDAIVREAEANSKYYRLKHSDPGGNQIVSFSRSICDAAYHSALDISAKLIIVFSESGFTAKEMSKLRSQIPIVALTTQEKTLFRFPMIWGVLPLRLQKKIDSRSDMTELEDLLKSHKLVDKGDKIVIIAGFSMNVGGTNFLRLHEIS
jgi:pyruvate kinase